MQKRILDSADPLLEELASDINRRRSEMRKNHYLRYRRVLQLLKLFLKVIWALLVILEKLR